MFIAAFVKMSAGLPESWGLGNLVQVTEYFRDFARFRGQQTTINNRLATPRFTTDHVGAKNDYTHNSPVATFKSWTPFGHSL